MEVGEVAIMWGAFKEDFLGKYFLEDVRSEKEIDFLELKQGNKFMVDYAAKFEELSRFCSHYNDVGAETSKCIKFESGLHSKVKQFIGFHEIRVFSTLVNKCRIYDEDRKARARYYKSVSDKRSKGQDRGKPYETLGDKGKKKVTGESNPNGGEVRYYNCGGVEHRVADCKNPTMTCYKCGESSHISTKCSKPKKVRSDGKVLALSVEEGAEPDNLIRGIC